MKHAKQADFWNEVRQLQDDIGEKLLDKVVLEYTKGDSLVLNKGISPEAEKLIKAIYKKYE